MTWLGRLLPARSVTLIVDDGPTAATPTLIDKLEAAGHRAVLFVLGMNIADNEAVMIDAVRRGFALGNHSFSHPYFSQICVAEAQEEITSTEALIDDVYRSAGVARPGRWFRFPYLDRGEHDAAALQDLLKERGFTTPKWVRRRDRDGDPAGRDWPTTVFTRDWALPSEAAFRESVRDAQPGDAIEFHDKIETIDRFLDALIDELGKRKLCGRIPARAR